VIQARSRGCHCAKRDAQSEERDRAAPDGKVDRPVSRMNNEGFDTLTVIACQYLRSSQQNQLLTIATAKPKRFQKRYAAEFFSFFFGGARPYIRAVAQLQDGLGAFNDAASATYLLRDVEAATGPQAAKAAGIVLGWCGRGMGITDDNLRKVWKSFTRARPFWH
jgi:CHAD domain-containing protein